MPTQQREANRKENHCYRTQRCATNPERLDIIVPRRVARNSIREAQGRSTLAVSTRITPRSKINDIPQDPACARAGWGNATAAPSGLGLHEHSWRHQIDDSPIPGKIMLDFPRQIDPAAEGRGERGARKAVDNVPRVAVAGGGVLRKRPLELPLAAVLRFDGGGWRWEERRGIVVVVMAQQVTGCSVLQLDPAAREGRDRVDKFPARGDVRGGGWLDDYDHVGVADPELMVVGGVDDRVIRSTDRGVIHGLHGGVTRRRGHARRRDEQPFSAPTVWLVPRELGFLLCHGLIWVREEQDLSDT